MSIEQSVKEFSFISYFLFSHNFCDCCACAPLVCNGGIVFAYLGHFQALILPRIGKIIGSGEEIGSVGGVQPLKHKSAEGCGSTAIAGIMRK